MPRPYPPAPGWPLQDGKSQLKSLPRGLTTAVHTPQPCNALSLSTKKVPHKKEGNLSGENKRLPVKEPGRVYCVKQKRSCLPLSCGSFVLPYPLKKKKGLV
jgi:hypothetical protein